MSKRRIGMWERNLFYLSVHSYLKKDKTGKEKHNIKQRVQSTSKIEKKN